MQAATRCAPGVAYPNPNPNPGPGQVRVQSASQASRAFLQSVLSSNKSSSYAPVPYPYHP